MLLRGRSTETPCADVTVLRKVGGLGLDSPVDWPQCSKESGVISYPICIRKYGIGCVRKDKNYFVFYNTLESYCRIRLRAQQSCGRILKLYNKHIKTCFSHVPKSTCLIANSMGARMLYTPDTFAVTHKAIVNTQL